MIRFGKFIRLYALSSRGRRPDNMPNSEVFGAEGSAGAIKTKEYNGQSLIRIPMLGLTSDLLRVFIIILGNAASRVFKPSSTTWAHLAFLAWDAAFPHQTFEILEKSKFIY